MKIPEITEAEEIPVLEDVVELESLEEVYSPEISLSGGDIVRITNRAFRQINDEMGIFNEEIAYLATELALSSHFKDEIDIKDVILLSTNFILGFMKFHGEDFVKINDFFKLPDISKFFNYNYAFLSQMTDMGDKARAFLFYKGKYDPTLAVKVPEMKLAALVFDAARIVVMLRRTGFNYNEKHIETLKWELFCPELADVFYAMDRDGKIVKKFKLLTYRNDLTNFLNYYQFTDYEKMCALRFLVYVFDFKSTQTLTHIISTASYAVVLGRMAGCDTQEVDELFVAGILHDIGKMAIPGSVLEAPGALSAEDFSLMKIHVDYTKKILQGLVPQNIYDIAIRHHEKLNGSGYPYGLTAQDLNLQQRVMTVADIFSALVDSRSYKGEFPKEKVIGIFKDSVEKNQLDADIVNIVINKFDDIKKEAMDVKKIFNAPLGAIEMLFSELEEYETLDEI